MPVMLRHVPKREYLVECDKCNTKYFMSAKNKQKLRDGMRRIGWVWKDTGIVGIVECVCPKCREDVL